MLVVTDISSIIQLIVNAHNYIDPDLPYECQVIKDGMEDSAKTVLEDLIFDLVNSQEENDLGVNTTDTENSIDVAVREYIRSELIKVLPKVGPLLIKDVTIVSKKIIKLHED